MLHNKRKSLKMNIFLNLLKTIFTTFFPLVSFKYVSSVLEKSGIGIINFSNSIVQYFSIIAALGVSTYAIRECTKVRDDRKQLNELSCELFTINVISTVVSYVCLIIVVLIIPKIFAYRSIVFILSVNIVCTTIGVEWVNIVQEDFLYITVRTIALQVVSLLLTFIFVRSADDYIIYAIITTSTSFFISILNWFYSKRYVNLKLVFTRALAKHVKPVLIIFSMNVAITIYVTSDITILGFFKGDAEVGAYTVATKVYSCLKVMLASVVSATIPRLSYVIEKDKEEYLNRLKDVISVSLLLCIPIIVGVFILPEFLIRTISTEAYFESKTALQLLGLAVLPTLFSTIINNNILLAQRRESFILFSACMGGVVNIVLNLIFIPLMGMNAAAATTLFAESLVFLISVFQARKTLIRLNVRLLCLDLFKVILGSLGIIILDRLYFLITDETYFSSIIFVIISAIMYFTLEIVLKQSGLLLFMKRRNMK